MTVNTKCKEHVVLLTNVMEHENKYKKYIYIHTYIHTHIQTYAFVSPRLLMRTFYLNICFMYSYVQTGRHLPF
jgi:hypothetical protein